MSTDQQATRTIQVDSVPVGLALAQDDTWSFVATDARFGLLDGSRFRRLAAAQAAAERLGRVVQGDRSPTPSTSWARFWGCGLALLVLLLAGADARASSLHVTIDGAAPIRGMVHDLLRS